MVDCKICAHPYCVHAGKQRGIVLDCANYKPSPKPQTNADRIRAMSDEELAEWLADDGWDCHNCSEHERLSDNPLLRDERCDEKCAEHCLDWLRQPVKDGDNDG